MIRFSPRWLALFKVVFGDHHYTADLSTAVKLHFDDVLLIQLKQIFVASNFRAKQILLSAISEMTFADARQILNGSQTAATDYFKGKTTEKLTAAFRPEIEKAMNDVGVTKQYKDLVGHFKAIPFAKNDLVNIDQYVVGKSLDGLFVMLADEERDIRTNPGARVTDLLKKVFAKTGAS